MLEDPGEIGFGQRGRASLYQASSRRATPRVGTASINAFDEASLRTIGHISYALHAIVAVGAAVALFRFKMGVMPLIVVCALLGVAWRTLGG